MAASACHDLIRDSRTHSMRIYRAGYSWENNMEKATNRVPKDFQGPRDLLILICGGGA